MFNIISNRDGDNLTIELEGTLDTLTAPDLKTRLTEELPGVKKLVFDMQKPEYISSDGLRTLAYAYKKMSEQGSMVVRNVSEDVMEVFEITNFIEFLTIE